MKKSFNDLSAIEKFALLWTAPVTLAVVIIISVLTFILYFTKVILVFSGTIGASQYLFGEIDKTIKQRQFKRLRNEDRFQSNFDALIAEKIKQKQQQQQ